MAASAFQRLQRVVDLEEKQGWRNRAVIGGISAMGERWADDARAENVGEDAIAAVLALLARYDAADEETRPEIAAALRGRSGGRFDRC